MLARVMPQTELHTYQLTTAENELGVVAATARGQDVPMVQISWTEMQCPVSLVKEPRKLARLCPASKLQAVVKTEVVKNEPSHG